VGEVVDGESYSLSTLGSALSIRADAIDDMERVNFNWDGDGFRSEGTRPFAMGGDNAGDYDKVDYFSYAGTKTVTIDALKDDQVISTKTIMFDLYDSEITGLFFINTDTNEEVGEVVDGQSYSLLTLGTALSIRADAIDDVERVNFIWDGDGFRSEGTRPFAMGGDSSAGYNTVDYLSSAGTKTVTVEAMLVGEVVSTTTVAFTMTV
jgi:hypothetical protein